MFSETISLSSPVTNSGNWKSDLDYWKKLIAEGEQLFSNNSQASALVGYSCSLEASRIAFQIFDKENIAIAVSLRLLGRSMRRIHLYTEAEKSLIRAAEIYSRHVDARLDLVRTKLDLVVLYLDAQNFEQSVQMLNQAAALSRQLNLKQQAETRIEIRKTIAMIMANSELRASYRRQIHSATVAERTNQLEMADFLYSRALVLARRFMPYHQAEIAEVLRLRANVLKKLGHNKDAHLVECEAVEIEKHRHPNNEVWRGGESFGDA